MKRNDWILAGIILLIAGSIIIVQNLTPNSINASVSITIDGNLYASYSLSENERVDINGSNILIIEEGKARMIDANCPDQLCVHQKAISKDGESIICLPNKIVVSIIGGEENELDAVTN